MYRLLCIVIRANNVASYPHPPPPTPTHIWGHFLSRISVHDIHQIHCHILLYWCENVPCICHVLNVKGKMFIGVIAMRMTSSEGGTLQHVSPECWHPRVPRLPGACVNDLELLKTAKCEKKELLWRHMTRPGHRIWICVSQLNNICTRVLRNSQGFWRLNVLHREYLDVRHHYQLRKRLENFEVGIMISFFPPKRFVMCMEIILQVTTCTTRVE